MDLCTGQLNCTALENEPCFGYKATKSSSIQHGSQSSELRGAPGVWESHKDEIARLYLVEQRILKDVAAIMRERHGVQARYG